MSTKECSLQHEVHCDVPPVLTHSTVIVVIQGMQADAESDQQFCKWLERYGHVVHCSYGYEQFCDTCVARTIARRLEPLRHTATTIVLMGCSKGFATMCDVLQRLRRSGFSSSRLKLVSPDGARGYEHVTLIPNKLARLAPLVPLIPIGPRVSRWPGRWIVRRFLAGQPRQERHWLQQIRSHIVHVLHSPMDLSGAQELVYLAGRGAHNGVLRQPDETQAMCAHADRYGVSVKVIDVLGGGHCDFDAQLDEWTAAVAAALRHHDVPLLPTVHKMAAS